MDARSIAAATAANGGVLTAAATDLPRTPDPTYTL